VFDATTPMPIIRSAATPQYNLRRERDARGGGAVGGGVGFERAGCAGTTAGTVGLLLGSESTGRIGAGAMGTSVAARSVTSRAHLGHRNRGFGGFNSVSVM
jgi:hypothetical protein